MKNLKTPEQAAQENKEGKQLLKAINEMIKTSSLRTEGFEKLLEIDPDSLSVNNQVFYYYIKAKYYVLEFKSSTTDKDLNLLSYGNDCYSDMVSIAYQNNISLKDAKYNFARAYCKYLIGIHHPSDEVKAKLFTKVEQIIGRVLCYDPTNSSCLWLQSQLLKA